MAVHVGRQNAGGEVARECDEYLGLDWPAGADRFTYEENSVYAIESITGSGPGAQVTLQTCSGCANPGSSTQPISSITGVWGGLAVGGFYEISSISGGNVVTLGTLIYNVPSDWSSASGDNSYCFGKLRWSTGTPSSDPPPILGRASVTSVSSVSSMVSKITTQTLTTLGMPASGNDTIDIYDDTMTLLSSNAAVTRIDDSHFTVPVALSTIATAAYIMTHGTPYYYWDDQQPKGDYVYTDWTWWIRLLCEATRWNTFLAGCPPSGLTCTCPSGTETSYCYPFYDPIAANFDDAFTQTAACVPFNPCNPSVLCISPNGEEFANGTTYGFNTIQLDETYGSGWQAEFQQVMTDLLYEPPHYPASNPCTPTPFEWLQDTGGCAPDTDTITYYAHAPIVEARLTLPSNGGPSGTETAPSLPSGISIGWASPAGLDADCGSPPADTLFPPGPNGYGLEVDGIWNFWIGMCNCISSSGEFAEQYENIITGCQ
jgi:hypothetical protein